MAIIDNIVNPTDTFSQWYTKFNNVVGLIATASSTNTPSTIVIRDATGNFSAGTITATLNGDASSVNGQTASQIAASGLVYAIALG